jgi:hypothetical protein
MKTIDCYRMVKRQSIIISEALTIDIILGVSIE